MCSTKRRTTAIHLPPSPPRASRRLTVPKARDIVVPVVQRLVAEVPGLAKHYYWAGTAAVSYEETEHWMSLDVDLHTKEVNVSIEREARLISHLSWVEQTRRPDFEVGMFAGETTDLRRGDVVSIELKTSYEEVYGLVPSSLVPGVMREGLPRYIEQKVQCLEERREPKDWWHLAVLSQEPTQWERVQRLLLSTADPVLLLARLKQIQDEPHTDLRLTAGEEKAFFAFLNRVSEVVLRGVRR